MKTSKWTLVYKLFTLSLLIFISSCQLYATAGVHDRSFDSEYVEDAVIATFGLSQEITDNFEAGIEHGSMPFFIEQDGHGVNKAYIKAKVKLF